MGQCSCYQVLTRVEDLSRGTQCFDHLLLCGLYPEVMFTVNTGPRRPQVAAGSGRKHTLLGLLFHFWSRMAAEDVNIRKGWGGPHACWYCFQQISRNSSYFFVSICAYASIQPFLRYFTIPTVRCEVNFPQRVLLKFGYSVIVSYFEIMCNSAHNETVESHQCLNDNLILANVIRLHRSSKLEDMECIYHAPDLYTQ